MKIEEDRGILLSPSKEIEMCVGRLMPGADSVGRKLIIVLLEEVREGMKGWVADGIENSKADTIPESARVPTLIKPSWRP